jgi:3-oxoacyl-[acyl-carrier-protein] synthase-3
VNKSKIISTGAYVPDNVMLNSDFEKILDTSDEWIKKRTGITKRYLLPEGKGTSFMCVEASKIAIANANIALRDIDAIIVATCTPDKTIPSVANLVQRELGCTNAFAFDIQAACAGFIFALSVADNYIKTGQVKNILLIGADAMSRIVDWGDRSTCVLFGDGAGAFVLSSSQEKERGVIATKLFSDASLIDALYTSGGVSSTKNAGTIVMDGKAVFEYAVKKIQEVIQQTLEENNYIVDDIDFFIIHQANIRIIELISKNLEIPTKKMIVTIDEFANTSSASIPISWHHYKERINKGDKILIAAMGSGFSWASALIIA